MSHRQIIVGVTGASGALYAGRLLYGLLGGGHTVHLVLSKYGRYLLVEELGFEPGKESVLEFLARLYGEQVENGELREYGVGDIACTIASGSVPIDGMVVVPCSMKTMAGIANGLASNLIERAADVSLKERRPLIVVPRETPLNLIQLRNMTTIAEAGAIVLPAMPAFYQKPESFDDLGDFLAGRICDLLGIDNALSPRWEGGQKGREN